MERRRLSGARHLSAVGRSPATHHTFFPPTTHRATWRPTRLTPSCSMSSTSLRRWTLTRSRAPSFRTPSAERKRQRCAGVAPNKRPVGAAAAAARLDGPHPLSRLISLARVTTTPSALVCTAPWTPKSTLPRKHGNGTAPVSVSLRRSFFLCTSSCQPIPASQQRAPRHAGWLQRLYLLTGEVRKRPFATDSLAFCIRQGPGSLLPPFGQATGLVSTL